MTLRQRLARRLRFLADRIDHAGAPKAIGWRFTFEDREGIRFREDGRGCRLWYLGDTDYEKAHTEADTEHLQVDWTTATGRRVGGQQIDTGQVGQTTGSDPSAQWWSNRAKVRRLTRRQDSGEMWECGRARPLDVEEYEHWMQHGLPFGWSILRPPAERLEEMTR